MKKLLTLAAGLALVASTAQAQSVTTTANPGSITTYATVTVNTILRLTINDTSTAISSPVEADFDAGFQDVGPAVTATVKANKGYTLSIAGGAATWTGTGGAQAAKPVGNLRWRTAGAAPGTALTTSNVSIASSASGTGGTATAVSYDIVWAYASDTPGTYTIPVVFTAAAP
ncbi:MAG: hypothetical protein ABJB33_07395 [Gemmatimonadota bacterium]